MVKQTKPKSKKKPTKKVVAVKGKSKKKPGNKKIVVPVKAVTKDGFTIPKSLIQKWKRQYPNEFRLMVRRSILQKTLTPKTIKKRSSIYNIQLNQKVDVVEGDLQCGSCRSKKIQREEMQTRSGDESATVFCRCTECGKRWKM